MTNQTNKPNEPGLWTREGKFYRVWYSEKPEYIGDEVKPDGHLGNEVFDGNWPTGNWHKLTAPATNAEARDKFRGWLTGHCNQSSDEQIADKAAEIFAGVERESVQEPGVIDQLYRHAIKCVDRVFQECTENPKPILPDFLGIGEDKFDGVVKLAEAYRKLSDKITTVTTKLEKYKRVLIENKDFCGAAAVRDCLQLLNGLKPKLLSEVDDEITTLKATVAKLEEQVATEHAKYINSERAATVALQAQTILKQADEIAELKRDPSPSLWEAGKKFREWLVDWGAKEWPTNDRIAKQALKIFSEVVPPKEQPEVIVGEGQAVTKEQAGWYAFDDPYGTSATEKTHNGEEGTGEFAMGSRYIKLVLPTFPPRKPAFVAPPKPERLIRWKDSGEIEWLIEEDYRKAIEIVELLDPTTGEPIKEQA